MKTKINALILVISLLILIGAGILLYLNFRPKPAGLLVRTTPTSSVYINGNFAGKSPLVQTMPGGEISLKLVPESSEFNLVPFETKISLIAGIQTVVRREFGPTEEDSSGDIISFDKGAGETSLVVVSTPDNAQVSLDGVPRGFSPFKTATIAEGEHQITVRSGGYTERVMTLKLQKGYRLTVFVKLGRVRDADSTPQPQADLGLTVEALTTPSGNLRLRSEPGDSGEEIAELATGSKYKFLEKDSTSTWFKIQYQEPRAGLPNGITGWIPAEFAKVTDGDGKEVNP
jgi:hypothetical protein